MTDTTQYLISAIALLSAIAILAFAGLKGLNAWISLKRAELDAGSPGDPPPTSAMNRIEIADLKERLRKLEAIAAGVDL